jgi:hypothetical protein
MSDLLFNQKEKKVKEVVGRVTEKDIKDLIEKRNQQSREFQESIKNGEISNLFKTT